MTELRERVARAIGDTEMPGGDALRTLIYMSDCMVDGSHEEALAHLDAILCDLADAALSVSPWLPLPPVPVEGVAPHVARDAAGILQQYLLIGRYPSNGQPTDVVHGWWIEGNADHPGEWARWRHEFPPTHYQPIAPLPSAPAVEG